ncbi:MAG: peptide chain release factor N(5)-glutamine methyltransferase [Desulfobacteraceae bacterium]|jgi:release factor glutamine methyltransferase
MPSNDASPGPKWTIIKTLEWTADYFRQHGIAQARAVAEILLAHILSCQRIDLYLRHDQPLNEAELARYKQVIRRRTKFEPEAYIVGQKEFWSLPLQVSADVLIPRPETECLVESVLEKLPADDIVSALELGVGSGAITIALAHERPQWCFWASDISHRAVAVARANAVRLLPMTAIRFFVGRWFEALDTHAPAFDLIVSNPPYIPTSQLDQLQPEIKTFEPYSALDGGADGMESLAQIIDTAHIHLNPGGWLILEMGHDQKSQVQQRAKCHNAYDLVEFRNDYSGYPRIAQIRRGPV